MPRDPNVSGQKKDIAQIAGTLSLIMAGTGCLLMLFGLFCLTSLQMMSERLQIDTETLTIISWVLMGAGLVDLGVARIFASKGRKVL